MIVLWENVGESAYFFSVQCMKSRLWPQTRCIDQNVMTRNIVAILWHTDNHRDRVARLTHTHTCIPPLTQLTAAVFLRFSYFSAHYESHCVFVNAKNAQRVQRTELFSKSCWAFKGSCCFRNVFIFLYELLLSWNFKTKNNYASPSIFFYSASELFFFTCTVHHVW